MGLWKQIRLARGAYWFLIGTVFFITGVVMTIGTLMGGYDHEWWVGPVGLLLGPWVGGHFTLLKRYWYQRRVDKRRGLPPRSPTPPR